MLIEPKDLRRILKRHPKSAPKQKLFIAYANLIAKCFAGGCRVLPAQTTNSVYVALPDTERMIRISDHAKTKADMPLHVFPDRHGISELADRLDRAIRAAYSNSPRDIPNWEQLVARRHIPVAVAI